MKTTFFGPMLCLGITMLIVGFYGVWSNLQKARASNIARQKFTERYRDSSDSHAIFAEALDAHKKVVFLQSEYTAFPASAALIGLIFILWAFDRRRMFRMCHKAGKSAGAG